MKKVLTASAIVLMLAGTWAGCKKTADSEVAESTQLNSSEKALVLAAGFNENWAEKRADGNYLIEGDIILTPAQLQEMSTATTTNNFVIANEEHYRTFELINT